MARTLRFPRPVATTCTAQTKRPKKGAAQRCLEGLEGLSFSDALLYGRHVLDLYNALEKRRGLHLPRRGQMKLLPCTLGAGRKALSATTDRLGAVW